MRLACSPGDNRRGSLRRVGRHFAEWRTRKTPAPTEPTPALDGMASTEPGVAASSTPLAARSR